MSTSVVITPATVASGSAGSSILPLAAILGTALWAGARALAAQDKACAQLLAKSREHLHRERVAMLALRTSDIERLARAAQEARFTVTRLPGGAVRLAAGSGSVLWAASTPTGVRVLGHEGALREILIANTTSRAMEHLRSRGLRVETSRSVTGEVCLAGRGSGPQAVEVNVGPSGEARVDLRGFRGKECEPVVRDLAAAIEGEITRFCPKPEYYGGTAVTLGRKLRA